MNQILENNLERIKTLCKDFNVNQLFAFGSVCTSEFKESSDIDLLISLDTNDLGEYADNYFAIANKLEQILNRPVDLVTDKSLSNPYFIESINKTKTLIYAR